jgi:hypothetical protein
LTSGWLGKTRLNRLAVASYQSVIDKFLDEPARTRNIKSAISGSMRRATAAPMIPMQPHGPRPRLRISCFAIRRARRRRKLEKICGCWNTSKAATHLASRSFTTSGKIIGRLSSIIMMSSGSNPDPPRVIGRKTIDQLRAKVGDAALAAAGVD